MLLQEQSAVEISEGRSDWRSRLDAVLATLDRPAFFPLILASIVYILVVVAWSTRPLWYDELFTHYIAKASTLDQFLSTLANFDLDPPLQAALTVVLYKLFGASDFVARIPSIVAFWIGSYCLFRFVSVRLGRFYGLTAMLVFWCTYFLRYASEARPIALLIAFFGIALVNWQQIAEGNRGAWRFVGVSIGVGGVLVSHVFGPVMLLALGLGEIVRSLAMKKLDWKMWVAFFSPAPLLLLYLPMMKAYSGFATLYPPEFQASIGKAFEFYGGLLTSCGWPLLIAIAAAVLVGKGGARVPGVRHEMALCAGLLAAPFLVNVLLMSQGGAFWERYCIGAGLGLGFLFAHVLARATGNGRVAGAAAVLVLLISVVIMRIVTPATEIAHRTLNPLSVQDLDAQIPFVTADGMTFLEMDQREDPALLSRVYYLTDRSAAEHYAHMTTFETFESLGKWFPVRAHVARYRDFVRTSKHFLVYGTLNNPNDWLLPKLLADGAQLRFLGEMTRGYKDTLMFDVVFPGPEGRSGQ